MAGLTGGSAWGQASFLRTTQRVGSCFSVAQCRNLETGFPSGQGEESACSREVGVGWGNNASQQGTVCVVTVGGGQLLSIVEGGRQVAKNRTGPSSICPKVPAIFLPCPSFSRRIGSSRKVFSSFLPPPSFSFLESRNFPFPVYV